MKNLKIYLITGVCGSGKTSVIKPLNKLLPTGKYDIHDLDERGVPNNAGRTWRFNETRYFIDLGNKNLEKGISTIICGFSRPSEVAELMPGQTNISFILLDAQPETIRKRILGRYPTKESEEKFTKQTGETISEFIDKNCNFLPVLRKECQEYKCEIVVTDDKSSEAVAGEVAKVVA
ncbi:MAG: hypothetical protein COV31_01055 [Candidatus Yanofskybacteria bacterium CG10_big_fil_rev_8_21_14_0_10_46_23]|uniref:Uncharacterized protein n=1 Tax=Candidatus Yanofskybacteria bacterium CG10_big_fil_rev_8_21_14_0_10_46_23 TaxID=1975098 RepID=A0A2H0R542_9BACT|nr:MAG: hypothetical protein COV31_01055 [Candidatus Yanofskybacteria bacterium CG10_big_fil_rev_8_21_14_0_10_46_23]